MSDATVVVVGLGVMGRGIARLFAQAGFRVVAGDADADRTRSGLERLDHEATEDGQPVSVAALSDDVRADLVVEAVSEDLAAKRSALARVVGAIGPDTIVATNTSSLSVDELAGGIDRPDRLVGLHFFNPPTRMSLVEVVVGTRTDPAVVERAIGWVEQIGRTPVRCVDSPGFIVNRVCRPLYMEGQRLVEQGVLPATVDALARRALGYRMGPLETLDLAGLHVHVAACEATWRSLGDPRYAPAAITRQLVRGGHTGRATGRGFYDHGVGRPSAQQAPLVRPSSPTDAGPVDTLGPGAVGAWEPVAGHGTGVALWRDAGVATDDDVAGVQRLVAAGRDVVVDSSDARWLTDLPAGASWLHLHEGPGGVVAEVVDDAVAGITPEPTLGLVLSAFEAEAVAVPAIAGLVVDRLWTASVNEATLLVEQSIAEPESIDLALRLGMGHPSGPFEVLAAAGAGRGLSILDMLVARTGDPRYRASALFRRCAAADQRGGSG